MYEPLTRIAFNHDDGDEMSDETGVAYAIVIASSTGRVEYHDAYKIAVCIEDSPFDEPEDLINIFDNPETNIRIISKLELEEALTHDWKIVRLAALGIQRGNEPLDVFDQLEDD